MLNRGAKLSEVQDILGHASPETDEEDSHAHHECRTCATSSSGTPRLPRNSLRRSPIHRERRLVLGRRRRRRERAEEYVKAGERCRIPRRHA